MLRRQFISDGLSAGAAAGLILPGTAAMAQAARTLPGRRLDKVNIVSTAGTTNLVLAALIERQGYFRDLGLEPNYLTVADGAKTVAALISGSADICPTSGFTQVFAAIERGAPMKIVAGGAIKNFYALFSANPQVRTLKDLEGRSVGIGALGAQLHQSMIALFRKYGVDSRKVRFANIGASVDVFKAVVAKVVDAGSGEIWLQTPDLHIVEHGKFYESLPEFTNQAAFVTQKAIAQKRDVIVRTLAAYARVYRFIMSGDSEAAFVAASAAALGGKGDPEAARTQWRFYRQIQPFAADLVLAEDRVRFMQNLNVLTGAQQQILPYGRVTDMTMARDAVRLIASGR